MTKQPYVGRSLVLALVGPCTAAAAAALCCRKAATIRENTACVALITASRKVYPPPPPRSVRWRPYQEPESVKGANKKLAS